MSLRRVWCAALPSPSLVMSGAPNGCRSCGRLIRDDGPARVGGCSQNECARCVLGRERSSRAQIALSLSLLAARLELRSRVAGVGPGEARGVLVAASAE